ncbi:polysaccharide biosynthesis protein [Alphaproteobacteria bacterium]|nr:polysaccharide biosynthesis protein [Alphaproteobacteria bacterium]
MTLSELANFVLHRDTNFFHEDLKNSDTELHFRLKAARILVIGAAGSIGREVVLQLVNYNPVSVHCVDISENGLVALTRKVRSTKQQFTGDFDTFLLDITSELLPKFLAFQDDYDYVFNLAASKHVRSEKDIYSLSRMIQTNVLAPIKIASCMNTGSLFCVSTDKATNPANLMGASKRLMELTLAQSDRAICKFSRFANVAFSDGSLLDGILQRIALKEPFSIPSDIKRYFMTPEEAGSLCLISGIMGQNKEIYFPKINEIMQPISFTEILERISKAKKVPFVLTENNSEFQNLIASQLKSENANIPVLLFKSDTPGEKSVEEFCKTSDEMKQSNFSRIEITQVSGTITDDVDTVLRTTQDIIASDQQDTGKILSYFKYLMSDFDYIEGQGSLNQKM